MIEADDGYHLFNDWITKDEMVSLVNKIDQFTQTSKNGHVLDLTTDGQKILTGIARYENGFSIEAEDCDYYSFDAWIDAADFVKMVSELKDFVSLNL